MTVRQLNDDELCALNWLKRQGHRDIRQPSADPPDFVVDGQYAVEVTRLNQRIVVGDEKSSKGEEQARIPLTDCMEKALRKLGPPGNEGRSWIVDCEYDFGKPLAKTEGRYGPSTLEALAPLVEPYDFGVVSAMHARHFDYEKHGEEISLLGFPHLCLACAICLDLCEFSHSPAKFVVPNVSDGYGIGVAEELNRSIQNRIQDKSDKILNPKPRRGLHKLVADPWWITFPTYQFRSYRNTNYRLSGTSAAISGLES